MDPPETRAAGKTPKKRETQGERINRMEAVLVELMQVVKKNNPADLPNETVEKTPEELEAERVAEEEKRKEQAKAEEERNRIEIEVQRRLVEERKRALEEATPELEPPVKKTPSAAAGSLEQLEGGVDKDAVALALNQMLGAGGEDSPGEICNSYFVAGTTVDPKIKKKIWSKEFIELGSLMSKPEGGSTVNMAYAQGSQSHLSFTPAKPRQPANIYEWVSMFSTFASIYTQKYPEESPSLFTYILRVMGLTKSHPASYIWRTYDEMFRKLKQYSQQLPWQMLNHHVLHEAQEAISNKPSSESKGKGPAPKGNVNKYCFNFNKKSGCRKTANSCLYRHICSKCQGAHSAEKCNKSSQGSRPGAPAAK